MFWEEVDVVSDNHQVANLELWVHTACSIRNKQCLNPQLIHHADGEGNLFHRVTLIVMETSLHSYDIDTAQFAENQLAAMSFDS